MNNKHNPNQTRIRLVAAVLIVVALIVVVGVIFVGRCLSFDDQGAHVIDRYGVLAREAEQQPADTGSAEPPEEKLSDEDEPQPQETDIRAVMLVADAVSDEDTMTQLIQLAQDGMLDTVIFNVKDNEGNLNIAVDTDEIDDVDYLIDSNADELEDAIGMLKDEGIYVIGRIYCMHDQMATGQNSALAMQFESGGTWLDYDNTRWLDPTNRDAVRYLSDVARSAAEAGCDEILLADFTFPTRGHLDRVEFDDEPDEQAAVLADVLEEIQDAADEVPVSLTADSLSDLTELAADGDEDGIPVGDVGALLSKAHRLFVPADDADEIDWIVETVRDAAEDAVVIPVFTDIDEWADYDGDAVLNAVFDSSMLYDLET